MINYLNRDVVIIGGGPAGLSAAIKLKESGIFDVLIIEREKYLGGILKQCIHDGFGLKKLGELLTGPEYASRYINRAKEMGIDTWVNSSVISLESNKTLTVVSSKGIYKIKAKAVVLAMGCREKTRGAISIAGSRPAGVYTAGVAQSYINIYNKMVGKEVIVLGSGDIGLIMARRLTLEGANVKGVYELLPYPSGLNRNVQQCLEDYSIDLHLSKTVSKIYGNSRIVGVDISSVDDNLQIIEGSEKYHSCDTLILSVGLIPENELSIGAGIKIDESTKGAIVDNNYSTNVEGIFAAGNVLHVHDLVDYVSIEAEEMAKSIVKYLEDDSALASVDINVVHDDKVSYCIPQKIKYLDSFDLSLRVKRPMKDVKLIVSQGDQRIKTMNYKKIFPAEMLRIRISSRKIKSYGNIEISILEVCDG